MNKIELRPIEIFDAEIINKIRNQSISYLHDDSTFTVEETKNWIVKNNPFWYVIILDGEIIGYFRLTNFSNKNRNIYIGADIEESHRGKGIGYSAYLIMMEKLFKERKLNKISLEVLSNNEQAHGLYKKIGFVVEGTKRQEIWRNGSWIDSIIMSMTRREFMLKYPGSLTSPCIGICQKNDYICSSCGRTIDQIKGWSESDPEQREITIASLTPKIDNMIKGL